MRVSEDEGGEHSPYLSLVIEQIPRLFSLQDREFFSPTYGCFDRTYWCWKFTDFPHPRFQEGVSSLAQLWSLRAAENPCGGHPKVLQWAEAGMRFWMRLQNSDGSFDEAYPFERSLAATAFTGFYVAKALGILKEALPPPVSAAVREALLRAGRWLCANDEEHGLLSNHLAAAAAACCLIGEECGDQGIRRRAEHFLQRIFDHQREEGWYEEYGGADPGYQTHATYYLAEIWLVTRDETLLRSLRRATEFLTHFIHPDGSLGGEYSSRNTEFYFPAGFEILAPVIPEAAAIARFMRRSVAGERAAGLRSMDTFNYFPMLNNYLAAARAASSLTVPSVPLFFQTRCAKHFPQAGLFVKSTDSYYAVVGLHKGGVVRVYDRETSRLKLSNSGWVAQLRNGTWVSSQHFHPSAPCSIEGDVIRVETDFFRPVGRVFNPFLFLAFRLFSLTVGRFRAASYYLKKRLVRALIFEKKGAALRLHRKIRFRDDGVQIEDEITGADRPRLRSLRAVDKFATIHMGSSRYFVASELARADTGQEGQS